MIEIRILISHTAPGLVNVATQTDPSKAYGLETRMAEGALGYFQDFLDDFVDSTNAINPEHPWKVIRKDYSKPQ